MRSGLSVFIACALLTSARAAVAATYAVGPGRRFPDLQAVAPLLRAGDRVEIDGGFTYPGGVILREAGTRDAKITIVGIKRGDRRPVIAGGATTLELRGGHYVIEGLEITGGSSRCVFHHADDITIEDSIVHDCPAHGILSADSDSGSLTLSYVEVYRAGSGEMKHPIYVASDEEAFPRSVFHMEHCYVHDGQGGDAVKSRAERNEIYSNWIEGGRFQELELVGPDGAMDLRRPRPREDSDVVGNVLLKTTEGYAVRVGGDGTGETLGRYRFVNNTILLGPAATGAFRLMEGLESIEMHNNALAREGGGPLRVLVEHDVHWAAGERVIAGQRNWVPLGSTGVPREWSQTLYGKDPGFASPRDPRPVAGSPLIGAGVAAPASPPRFAFPAPLMAQRDLPPKGTLERVGTATSCLQGSVDIGAYRASPGTPVPTPPLPPRTRGCACASLALTTEPVEALPAIAAVVALMAACAARRR